MNLKPAGGHSLNRELNREPNRLSSRLSSRLSTWLRWSRDGTSSPRRTCSAGEKDRAEAKAHKKQASDLKCARSAASTSPRAPSLVHSRIFAARSPAPVGQARRWPSQCSIILSAMIRMLAVREVKPTHRTTHEPPTTLGASTLSLRSFGL